MKEMWVQSLGWEDPMEQEMATHSSILVWEIPWTEEPGGRPSMGSQRVGHSQVHTHTPTHSVSLSLSWFDCHKSLGTNSWYMLSFQ